MRRSKKLKMVRMQFLNLHEQDEIRLRKFLNDCLLRGEVILKQSLDIETNARSDFRVIIDLSAEVTTQGSNTLPAQIFSALVKDISVGGACLAIDPDQPLVKNGKVQLTMDFVEKNFSVEGQILGLKIMS